jgi:anthranilate phosphoribosyltransferase
MGGTVEKNVEITKRILSGEKGPKRNIVLLNSSIALMAAGKVSTLTEGLSWAIESIDKGYAESKLKALISFYSERG